MAKSCHPKLTKALCRLGCAVGDAKRLLRQGERIFCGIFPRGRQNR